MKMLRLPPALILLLLIPFTAQGQQLPEALISNEAKVERLATGMRFTEGPVWLPEQKLLVFSDIPNSVLMQWSEAGGLKEFRKSAQANGNLLDLEGRLLSCQHEARNVIRTEKDGSIKVLAEFFGEDRFNSPNDIAVKSDGSLWFTDPSYGLKARKAEVSGKHVYRINPATGQIGVVCKHFDMPNGIVFSPDEMKLYIADTGSLGKILVFDVLGESLADEPAFEIPIRSDGMCVDERGNIYTTSRGGVHVFKGDGTKIGVIPVREHPANVCFGGDDFKTLFITARKSLYAVPMNVAGHRVKAKDAAKVVDPVKLTKTKAALAKLGNAITLYELEYNRYPKSLEQLVEDKFLLEIPTDGWGNPIDYDAATGRCHATGPDGKRIEIR